MAVVEVRKVGRQQGPEELGIGGRRRSLQAAAEEELSRRVDDDADPGPGDLDHPGDARPRAVPAAGGAGGQAAGAGGVHHAAAAAAHGELVGVGPRQRPAHHEHHDVRWESKRGCSALRRRTRFEFDPASWNGGAYGAERWGRRLSFT